MNYRERFFAAMDQKPVDRVPVGFRHRFFVENRTGPNSIDSHIIARLCARENDPKRLDCRRAVPVKCVNRAASIENLSLPEGRNFFGGMTCPGGFDNRPGSFLYTATWAEIEQEVAGLIAQGGKSGFILGSDCSIFSELPEERIRWVVEAARKI